MEQQVATGERHGRREELRGGPSAKRITLLKTDRLPLLIAGIPEQVLMYRCPVHEGQCSSPPPMLCAAGVHGLAKHTELDGRRGQVVGFQHGRCGELRWQVRMNGRVAAFRESNLHFATCEADLLALSSRRLLLSCHFDHARSHAFAHLLQLVILQRRNG